MGRKIALLFLVCTCFNLSLKSQALQLDFLFSAGLTYSSEFHGASKLNQFRDFNFSKHQLQFIAPLRTKINLDLKNFNLKKMNLSSSQLFLTSKIGLNQSNFTNGEANNIYKMSIGITGLNAGIRQGIWIYSANIYFDESEETYNKNIVPNFRGYGARVKVKSFDFIYFYGAALVVNQGKFYPVPVLGFQKKLAKNLKTRIVFPVEAKLNYKVNSKFDIDMGANFDGLNTIYREGSALNNSDASVNYSQLKPYLALNSKIVKQFKLRLEGGMSVVQQYNAIENNHSQDLGESIYIAFSLNYQFGKSLFGQLVTPK